MLKRSRECNKPFAMRLVCIIFSLEKSISQLVCVKAKVIMYLYNTSYKHHNLPAHIDIFNHPAIKE